MSLRCILPSNARACRSTRGFAVIANSSPTCGHDAVSPFQVFDRHVKEQQKDRAASQEAGTKSRTVDYVRNFAADNMIERLTDVKRNFTTILDLGSGPGHFSKLLTLHRTSRVLMLDSSRNTLYRDADSEFQVAVDRIHADEERLLEVVGRDSQEAIVSCLSQHWINDLPGMFVQIKEALKPDGLFLAALFGGDTLFELRTSLQLAEMEREGGVSPHISPMTDARDIANLLGRAGFTLLTVDVDEIKVTYPTMFQLLEDLHSMGESNAIIGRRHILHRDTLAAASSIYKELHGEGDGTIPATFQIIFLIGWKPASSQPKSLQRGSGKIRLKDAL